MIDNANIYKLSEEQLEEIKADLWKDSMPNIKYFAKNLKKFIKHSDTPFILSLEASYGMGKTYFSTRFAEFLKQGEDNIEAIYFSAWENDYFSDPFLSFSKGILGYFQGRFKTLYNNIKKGIKNVASSISLSAACDIKAVQAQATIDIGKVIDGFSKKDDPISDFKVELKKLINKLNNKKLVIIVDELDRCRPDYAIKVFETIKHFFDVEGVFIIIPLNNEAIYRAVKSLYSLEDKEGAEKYLKKFINDNATIPSPDYSLYVKQVINDVIFEKEIRSEKFNIANKPFTNISTLQDEIIGYANRYKPTLRELSDLIAIIKHFCINKNERIRGHLIPFFVFKKFVKNHKNKEIATPEYIKLAPDFASSSSAQFSKDINTLITYKSKRWITIPNENWVEVPDITNLENACNNIQTYADLLSVAQNFKELLSKFVFHTNQSTQKEMQSKCDYVLSTMDDFLNKYGFIDELGNIIEEGNKYNEYENFVYNYEI